MKPQITFDFSNPEYLVLETRPGIAQKPTTVVVPRDDKMNENLVKTIFALEPKKESK
jgi:formaldehyde-activating enzyme involved in methanogenesis